MTGHIPILLYHSVCESPPSWIAPFTVSPAQFERHLDLVVASGREAMTVSEFVKRVSGGVGSSPLERPPVVITFDDGFADFVTTAGPAMSSRGLPSTLYIATGSLTGSVGAPVGADSTSVLPAAEMMRWEHVPLLADMGVEVGAHAHTHPQLDLLSAEAARVEIDTSRELLEQVLGVTVPSFAYPHGHSSRRLRGMVEALGFTSAAGVRNRFSTVDDNVFNLARLTVRDQTPDVVIAAWLDGHGAAGPSPIELPKAMMGRLARRCGAHRPVAVES